MKYHLELSCVEDLFYDIFLCCLAILPIQVSWCMCVYAGHIPARWRRASLLTYATKKDISGLNSTQLENIRHLLDMCTPCDSDHDQVDDVLVAWVGSSPGILVQLAEIAQEKKCVHLFMKITKASMLGNAKLARPDQDKLCASLLRVVYLRLLTPDYSTMGFPTQAERCMSTWMLTGARLNLSCLVELTSYFNQPPGPEQARTMSFISQALLPIYEHIPRIYKAESTQDMAWMSSHIRAGRLSGLAPKSVPQARELPCL